jgi:hypothetical protein
MQGPQTSASMRVEACLATSSSPSFSPTKSFKTQAFLFYYFYSSLSFTSMIFGKRKEKVGLLIPLD